MRTEDVQGWGKGKESRLQTEAEADSEIFGNFLIKLAERQVAVEIFGKKLQISFAGKGAFQIEPRLEIKVEIPIGFFPGEGY